MTLHFANAVKCIREYGIRSRFTQCRAGSLPHLPPSHYRFLQHNQHMCPNCTSAIAFPSLTPLLARVIVWILQTLPFTLPYICIAHTYSHIDTVVLLRPVLGDTKCITPTTETKHNAIQCLSKDSIIFHRMWQSAQKCILDEMRY